MILADLVQEHHFDITVLLKNGSSLLEYAESQ